MRISTKRTGFSKRRSRRKTSFPLVAVVQKRSQVHYRSTGPLSSLESKESSARSGGGVQSLKKSRGTIDYKNVVLLRKLITAEGKILPRRINKLTAKQQRYTSKAIKSARIVGLLPFINWSRSLNIEYKQKSRYGEGVNRFASTASSATDNRGSSNSRATRDTTQSI